MSITVKHNTKPKLKICKMLCDGGLDAKLNMYSLTSLMNHHSLILACGAPGSGKTSLLYSFFQSKKLFRGVFHTIFLFQPESSRRSMEDKIFDQLDPSQLYDELTYDGLTEVIDRIEASGDDENHIIIFDDCTAQLKDKKLKNLFKKLVFNRRHLRTSIFFLVQTYKSIDLSFRKVFKIAFIFKVLKKEMEVIFDELLEKDKETAEKISKFVFDKKYNFLFISLEDGRMFKNWDEFWIKDKDETEDQQKPDTP